MTRKEVVKDIHRCINGGESKKSVYSAYAMTEWKMVAGGAAFTRTLVRDPYRRDLVLDVANSAGDDFAYSYDALSRPVARNGDAFAYNSRSEVVSSCRGAENAETYSYDEIGNLLYASSSFATNTYAANNLNQYSSISALRASASPRELEGGAEAAQNIFEVSVDGMTYFEHDSENLDVRDDDDVNH